MSDLLGRLTRINIPVDQKRDLAGKIKTLNAAEIFDPRISRIYYSDLSELPDAVKNHPAPAQRAFMATFNNILRKTGDQPKAMRGAWKALRNRLSQIEETKRRMRRTHGVDETLIRWHVKRAVQGPTPQIVVP